MRTVTANSKVLRVVTTLLTVIEMVKVRLAGVMTVPPAAGDHTQTIDTVLPGSTASNTSLKGNGEGRRGATGNTISQSKGNLKRARPQNVREAKLKRPRLYSPMKLIAAHLLTWMMRKRTKRRRRSQK